VEVEEVAAAGTGVAEEIGDAEGGGKVGEETEGRDNVGVAIEVVAYDVVICSAGRWSNRIPTDFSFDSKNIINFRQMERSARRGKEEGRRVPFDLNSTITERGNGLYNSSFATFCGTCELNQ
jgi:hypothetical protein